MKKRAVPAYWRKNVIQQATRRAIRRAADNKALRPGGVPLGAAVPAVVAASGQDDKKPAEPAEPAE